MDIRQRKMLKLAWNGHLNSKIREWKERTGTNPAWDGTIELIFERLFYCGFSMMVLSGFSMAIWCGVYDYNIQFPLGIMIVSCIIAILSVAGTLFGNEAWKFSCELEKGGI